MNPKTTIGLVIALVFATIGIWWVNRSETSGTETPKPNAPTPLFDKPIDDVVGFELVKGKEAFVFEKVDNTWRMKAPIKSPAQSSTVASDVTRITGLNYVKAFAASDPERPADKQTSLASPFRVVKLTGKDGQSRVIKIGAMQALASRTYVQKEGDDTIYLVEGDLGSDFNRRLSDYRGTRVVDAAVPDIVKLEATGAASWSLAKTDNTWTLEAPVKGRADQSKAAAIASAAANVTAQTFVEDNPQNLHVYGLDSPAMTLNVTIEKKTARPPPAPPASMPSTPEYDIDIRVVKLRVGGMADEKLFAQLEDPENPAVFQIPKATFTQLSVPLDELRDKRITAASTPRAQKLTVVHRGARTELVKNNGRWEFAAAAGAPGEPADATAVDDVLKAIAGLTALGFEPSADPAFGLASPRAEIELVVEGKTTPTRLIVGGLTPSKTGAYIQNAEEEFVAVVAADSVEPLLVSPQAFLSRDLLAFSRDRAAGIEVTKDGVTRTLENNAGKWAFTTPVAGDAEEAAVNAALTALVNLRGRRVIATAAEAANYGLAGGDAVKVSVLVNPPPKPQPATAPDSQPVEPPDPPVKYTVILARTADGKTVAMLETGRTICEIDAKVYDDLTAELFETHVVTLEPNQTKRLTVTSAAPVTFSKESGKWQLAGESTFPVDPAKMTSYLDALRDMRLKHYVRYTGANLAEFGLDQPALTVAVETESGSPFELRVSGRGPTDDTRFATSSAGLDRVFVLAKDDVAKLDKQAKDFQNVPGGTPPPPPPTGPGMIDHSGHGH